MRHALALSCTALVLMACARSSDPRMQPNPGTGYTVQTTGAPIGLDITGATETRPPVEDTAVRLAAEICDRELRCHAATHDAERCLRANLVRTERELSAWRCSPAATRARAERCLASIGNEPCELDLASRPSLCVSNAACGAEALLPSQGTGSTPRRD